ncbi:hypothetical protein NHX12_026914 [Muraenolepis orangiensis]|uniref:Macrophage immunometabolism regulator n=1 Tax=Muraenolepis orangiensis TaxID=630683 RepID=A0A9Q0EI17_9TELE|nr:hypothetical protein NHX12_026914 [Muraenolepis orangiensis]
MDVGGVSRKPVPILSEEEAIATFKQDVDRPRCASTPCSPIKSTVAGYQIVHMDSNYLVRFTTGEELLKMAQQWSTSTPEQSSSPDASPSLVPTAGPKASDLGIHRGGSHVLKAKSRSYQPYGVPAANGRSRRRMPSSGDTLLRSLAHGESRKGLHGPLPLCLFKANSAQVKSLDYLNLDKMNIRESTDTEVLQFQLQHLTLRGECLFSRNQT